MAIHVELYNKMWIWFDLICKWQIDIHECQHAYDMLFLHTIQCVDERKSFITNTIKWKWKKKRTVISKLARLDAPDFMSERICSRGCNVMRIKEIEQPKNRNRRWCYRAFIGCSVRSCECVFINPVLLTAQCVNWFFYSFFFCFIELSYILFFDNNNTNMWVRAVFSSSFSTAFYFFSSRVFRWTLRIFQLQEKAHNFSFILWVVVVVAIFLSSHTVTCTALAQPTPVPCESFRYYSGWIHRELLLFKHRFVSFIAIYLCASGGFFTSIFRLEQRS